MNIFYFCINLGYNFCAFLGRECLTNVIKCSTNLAFEPICELLNQIPYPLLEMNFLLVYHVGYLFCAFLGLDHLNSVIKCSTNLAFEPLCELFNQIQDSLPK